MLDNVANNLFALLRLGIDVGPISDVDVSSLCSMTETDWELLKLLAEKQGVSILALDGLNVIDKKHEGFSDGINVDWWKRFLDRRVAFETRDGLGHVPQQIPE